MQRLSAAEISKRREIELIDIGKGRGVIQAHGEAFNIQFDDLLDLVQAVEMIMLKLTGKIINASFRPAIKNRAGLACDVLLAGDLGKCESEKPAGVGPEHFYMLVEIAGNVWENWFTRLDELIKMLYIIVKEAQGDEYKPDPAILVPQLGSA